MTFDDMGYYLKRLNPEAAKELNDIARKKYGENHSKFAALLDLTVVSKTDITAHVKISEFGKYFVTLSKEERERLVPRLSLRIPIAQNYFCNGRDTSQIDKDMEVLSVSTQKRRRPNVETVIRSIEEELALTLF